MPQRTSKRIYSRQSIEVWFEHLGAEWEKQFSELELERGRDLYRQGQISEVELSDNDAIIHAKVDGQSCYAVLEWSGARVEVRGSMKDPLLMRALGSAGLYEVEELVADEAALAPIDDIKQSTKHRDKSPDTNRKDAGGLPRRMLIRLSAGARGLKLNPYWMAGKAGEVHLFKEAESREAAKPVNNAERELMIRLTSLARKSGFSYQAKQQEFAIKAIPAVKAFFEQHLKPWEEGFILELDPVARRLRSGVVKAQVSGVAAPSLNGSMQMNWHVKAGRRQLESRETRSLLRGKGEMVILPRIGLVHIDKDQAEALEEWLPYLDAKDNADPPRYLLFSLFDQPRLKVEISEELGHWKDRFAEKAPALDLPDFLRPYQKDGARWLARLAELGCHSLLADEMGLGKTLQTLALIQSRPLADLPHLIVCPASVVPVWCQEMSRFFPELKHEVIQAGSDFGKSSEPIIWVGSYAQLRRHRSVLDEQSFGYVVLDEAQQIKNPDAKVSQACYRIRARHRIALTGTPVENRPLDLWSLFRFLMPGLLGSRRRFEEAESGEAREALLEKVRRQTLPFILRRNKSEVVQELPPKVEMDLSCPLSAVQRTEYERLTKEGLQAVGRDLGDALKRRSMSLFTLLTRLRQASCDPGLLPWSQAEVRHSGKITALMARLEEAFSSGGKVVIFSQFTSFLSRIETALKSSFPDLPLYSLSGKTPDRSKPVKAFQACKGAGVILVSLRAGGVGITLHHADYLFLMDPWWNPAVEAQAVDRVHRIGQKRTVFIYRLVSHGTVEDRINRLKHEKRELFDQIVQGSGPGQDLATVFENLESLISLQPTLESEA